jgi:hypothetical protein
LGALLKERENNGRRLLLGEDGSTIEIVPGGWEDGIELTALVDLAIPDERIMRNGTRPKTPFCLYTHVTFGP